MKVKAVMVAACVLAAGLAMAEGKKAPAAMKTVKFTGKQVKGTGPLNNAKTSSDILVVNTKARITKAEGTSDYCIWKQGGYRAYKCSSKSGDLVNSSLPAGRYTILPAVGKHQSSAWTTITVTCPSCQVTKK